MRLICLVMHLVFSKILKYALQTFLRFIIHMIYTGFTHFCREISLVAITRFGRQFWAKYTQEIFDNIYKALEIFDCFGFLTLFPLITCASWALAATNPATSLEKYS